MPYLQIPHSAFYGGGISGVNLTLVIGFLFAILGGGYLIVEIATIAYREYQGRTRFHRSRTTAVRRIAVAAVGLVIGLILIFGTGPGMNLP